MTVQVSEISHAKAKSRYLLLMVVLLGVIVVGYLDFRWLAAGQSLQISNLYLLAMVAGVASFFSPCAFPLLPSYLSFFYLSANEGQRDVKKRAYRLGLWASLGVLTFTLMLGSFTAVLGVGVGKALSITGAQPNSFVLIFRALVGLTLLVLGIAQINDWNLKPAFVDTFVYRTAPKRDNNSRPGRILYLYGLGYTAAGIGCTGPILAGLMVSALSLPIDGAVLGAFSIFAVTMSLLMLVVTGIVGASQDALITGMKAAGPRIKTAAGFVLIVVGGFHIWSVAQLDTFFQFLFP